MIIFVVVSFVCYFTPFPERWTSIQFLMLPRATSRWMFTANLTLWWWTWIKYSEIVCACDCVCACSFLHCHCYFIALKIMVVHWLNTFVRLRIEQNINICEAMTPRWNIKSRGHHTFSRLYAIQSVGFTTIPTTTTTHRANILFCCSFYRIILKLTNDDKSVCFKKLQTGVWFGYLVYLFLIQ